MALPGGVPDSGARTIASPVAALVHGQAAANKRRAALMVAAFAVGVALVAGALATVSGLGLAGLALAVLLAGVAAFGAWWKSGDVALGVSHARPADPVVHARLHNVVDGLCVAAGLPKPRLYVVEDSAPNAFAAGRDPEHAVVVVTSGLLDALTRVELEGVLAHELSHIKNHDISVSTLAVTVVGSVALVAQVALRFWWWGGPRHTDDRRPGTGPLAVVGCLGFALLPLTPLVARAMRLTVARRRETLADVTGVALTRYPPGLISALEKIRDGSTVVHSAAWATAHLWLEAPIAQTPSEGRMSWLNRRFTTHPPLDERIQALREL